MNNQKIEIYVDGKWQDFTANAVQPFKLSNLLDEQLDEASVTLKRTNKPYFQPLTRVRITYMTYSEARFTLDMVEGLIAESDYTFKHEGSPITINTWTSDDKNYIITWTRYANDGSATGIVSEERKVNFLVASDNAVEVLTAEKDGEKVYDHELYLIELTKITEGFIGDSITFTNALPQKGGKTPIPVTFVRRQNLNSASIGFGYLGDNAITYDTEQQSTIFGTPWVSGEIILPPVKDILFNEGYLKTWVEPSNNITKSWQFIGYPITVNNPSATMQSGLQSFSVNGTSYSVPQYTGAFTDTGDYADTPPEYKFNVNPGTATAVYRIFAILITQNESGGIEYDYLRFDITYIFSIVQNRLPLKKWTITDVITRSAELLEPLSGKENANRRAPRFRLNGVTYDKSGDATVESGQAKELDEILAPEFAFTKMTFREMLQQVGGYIHAEPRISAEKRDIKNNMNYFEIVFDKYGETKQSYIKNKRYFSAGLKTSVNDYCTGLDSSADNLISQIDYAQGVVVEPFNGGYKSLRCASASIRLAEDDNTYIETNLPQYTAKKQVIVKLDRTINGKNFVDITPYIFEQADYNNLSSYGGNENKYSKAFALYYEQGTKNIKGLFFKDPAVIESLQTTALTNILRAGIDDYSINYNSINDAVKLAFQVSYLPIQSARIKTTKQTVIGGLPRELAYNQTANAIETRYYGENLKGAVARLGNVEKTYTYHLAFMWQIPKVGLLFDDDYYISSVSVEYLPLYISCTIGLSKDFNRLSEYVGINSNKRMWQVSEKQSIERQSVYRAYIKVSENTTTNATNLTVDEIAESLFNTKRGDDSTVAAPPISLCVLRPKDYNKNPIKDYKLAMSVASVSMGNTMTFSCRCKDNYSAGQKILPQKNADGTVTGTWAVDVPFGDYYGRAYYLDFEFLRFLNNMNADNLPEIPSGTGTASAEIKTSDWRYRKDSREVPEISLQLCVVSDDPTMIIGSALCENSCLVNKSPVLDKDLEIYSFSNRLNPIDGRIDLSSGEKIEGQLTISGNTVTLPAATPENSVAWAIVLPQHTDPIQVEDETGKVTTQSIETGSRILLGQNRSYPHRGATFYFTIHDDLYASNDTNITN